MCLCMESLQLCDALSRLQMMMRLDVRLEPGLVDYYW